MLLTGAHRTHPVSVKPRGVQLQMSLSTLSGNIFGASSYTFVQVYKLSRQLSGIRSPGPWGPQVRGRTEGESTLEGPAPE
jgi:hypothetical protein